MKVDIYTDGGARGNPGPAAFGFVIWRGGTKLKEHGEYIGEATNNIAEYIGLLKALEFASKMDSCDSATVFLDSLLIQKQMTGEYKIKNETLKQYAKKVKELESNFKDIEYVHVRREKNKDADALVNIALDNRISQ